MKLELPEEMRGRFSEFPERATFVRVSPDREIARRLPNIAPMDFKSPFFTSLVEFAKSPEFKGEYASVDGPASGVLGLYKLRWQNDQGIPRQEELLPVFLPAGSKQAELSPSFFGHLLHQANETRTQRGDIEPSTRGARLKMLDDAAERRLSSRCSSLRHPNDVVLLAAADLYSNE